MKILESTDVGTCKKKLTVEIPPEEVSKELEDIYAEFSRNADVPGFRRGHAPRYVLRMRYGRVLEKEAVRKAADEAFKKATEETELHTVTDPEFKDLDKITYKAEEPITFSAEVEF
ncbi:MAG: trigger factor family protein, partial [bacterium]